jgi:serine/threonine-protein kinase RsbW/stage II sporulation protein AB (anti-sigma F factor)
VAVQRAGPGYDSHDESPPPVPPLPATLSHSLPATADSVGRLRRAVANFAARHGASDRSLESVNLALSEALTNVVLHAYRDAARPGPVLVVAVVRDRALVVTIADEGCGMTPRPDSPGLGLGMGLIARLADTFEVTPRGARPGIVVRMAFALAG